VDGSTGFETCDEEFSVEAGLEPHAVNDAEKVNARAAAKM
jgi:hypothetical protein